MEHKREELMTLKLSLNTVVDDIIPKKKRTIFFLIWGSLKCPFKTNKISSFFFCFVIFAARIRD